MKKLFLLFTMLTTTVFSFAQVGWTTEVYNEDELLGTEGYVSYIYTDDKKDYIVLWSNDETNFRIVSNTHIFNYNSGGPGGSKWFSTTIGLYDEAGKLVEKTGLDFYIQEGNPRVATSEAVLRKEIKEAKKINDFIRNGKGSVRIIAPLYGSISGFDIVVPCFQSYNQNEKKQHEKDALSKLFKESLDQLQRIQIFGVRDSVSMNSYLSYLKQWGNSNSLKYGITVDDTVSSNNKVLMHVETRICPNLVSSKTLDIPIFLLYDIDVTIDTLPFNGFVHINNIRIRWEYEHDFVQNHAPQLLNLPSQKLEALSEEMSALTNSILASGIKAEEFSSFLLNEAWLNAVQNAEDTQIPQAKVYLELFTSVIINTSWLIRDFPDLAK